MLQLWQLEWRMPRLGRIGNPLSSLRRRTAPLERAQDPKAERKDSECEFGSLAPSAFVLKCLRCLRQISQRRFSGTCIDWAGSRVLRSLPFLVQTKGAP